MRPLEGRHHLVVYFAAALQKLCRMTTRPLEFDQVCVVESVHRPQEAEIRQQVILPRERGYHSEGMHIAEGTLGGGAPQPARGEGATAGLPT